MGKNSFQPDPTVSSWTSEYPDFVFEICDLRAESHFWRWYSFQPDLRRGVVNPEPFSKPLTEDGIQHNLGCLFLVVQGAGPWIVHGLAIFFRTVRRHREVAPEAKRA